MAGDQRRTRAASLVIKEGASEKTSEKFWHQGGEKSESFVDTKHPSYYLPSGSLYLSPVSRSLDGVRSVVASAARERSE